MEERASRGFAEPHEMYTDAEEKHNTLSETCERILAKLEEAHAIAGRIDGPTIQEQNQKWPEPQGSLDRLSQQIRDISVSVVELTARFNRIAQRID